MGYAARQHTYHPIRQYLKDSARLVEDWTIEACEEATGRLLADLIGCKPRDPVQGRLLELRTKQSRNLLISAVARAFAGPNGVKVDVMPVLCGRQGLGKSTAIRSLVPYVSWYSDTPLDLRNKDCMLALSGVWLYEIAELRSILSVGSATSKAFLTSAVDRFRAPYARAMESRPRHCVFVGSANPPFSLPDHTGNRRYELLEMTERPNLGALDRYRGELWGAAYRLYKAGHKWHLEEDEWLNLVQEEREEAETVDPWLYEVRAYADDNPGSGITTRDFLASYIGKVPSRQTRKDAVRLSACFRKIGAVMGRSWSGKSRVRMWYMPEIDRK